jgi:hypothetical protein
MTSCRFVLACLLVLAAPLTAAAAQGDPRLVNGVLEWPRALTNESFVIVRGDDGVLYYVGVASARREGTPAAGARVAVLGIEGRSAHEIAAVGLGIGTTADAALAQLQGARPAPVAAPPAATPPPVAAGPAPIAPPTAASGPASGNAAVTSPAPTSPAPPAPAAVAPAPSAPAAVAPAPAPPAPAAVAPAPAPSAPAAVAPAPAPPAPAAVAPAPAITAPAAPAPAPVATPAAPVVPATPVPVSPAETSASASSAAPRGAVSASPATAPAPTPAAVTPASAVATAPMTPVDDRRWTELVGEVEKFVGRTLVLRVDGGGRVSVDVSSLSGNLERMVAPGSRVKVYGVPVELRFKALGFIDPDARGRGR